jgi:hypothetical protein
MNSTPKTDLRCFCCLITISISYNNLATDLHQSFAQLCITITTSTRIFTADIQAAWYESAGTEVGKLQEAEQTQAHCHKESCLSKRYIGIWRSKGVAPLIPNLGTK